MNVYRSYDFGKEYQISYVESYRDGNKFQKLIKALKSIFRTALWKIRYGKGIRVALSVALEKVTLEMDRASVELGEKCRTGGDSIWDVEKKKNSRGRNCDRRSCLGRC